MNHVDDPHDLLEPTASGSAPPDANESTGSDNITELQNAVHRDESLALIELAVLTFIFALTVVGNLCVLVALNARRSKMTRMYYFLVHLCVSDLTTAFFTVLPQLGWDATYRFRGGNFFCKCVKYGQILGPYLSSYVLVVTAVDRYQAICFPLSNCSWTPTKSKLLVSLAWAVSLLCCVPQLFVFSYQEVAPGVYDCWGTYIEPWGLRAYVTWYALSVFFIPLLVLVFTYVCICRAIWQNLYLKRKSSDVEGRGKAYRFKSPQGSAAADTDSSLHIRGPLVPRSHSSARGLSRAKIKTVKITVVVISFYIICSSPFICVQMWMYWGTGLDMSDAWTNATVTILMLLNSLNSCVNPWIYLFFNRNLVQALRQQVCCCCCRQDRTVDGSNPRGTGGLLPEITTQGTDINVSRQSSPVCSTPRKTFDSIDMGVRRHP
ncbi:oxytocin receptor-like [Dermacentor variabilis]|uniref:oxytocin receptor-like n=1 Tax=Dermacentor variabilis TaxID=34621 RepID=UPI003F5BB7C8